MLKYLPNALTLLRLLLTLPLGWLILEQRYADALIVGSIAGLTDALDGVAARRLDAYSRLGAALDPIADKLLITVCMLTFATVSLIPMWLAAIVIGRDLVIIAGASCYHWLIGRLEFEPTGLSKANMLVQTAFCILVLLTQVVTVSSTQIQTYSEWLVALIALASGLHYVWLWGNKARIQTQQAKVHAQNEADNVGTRADDD